ncbi:hypothetical protein ACFXTH_045414 [Malus domestica]
MQTCLFDFGLMFLNPKPFLRPKICFKPGNQKWFGCLDPFAASYCPNLAHVREEQSQRAEPFVYSGLRRSNTGFNG